MENLNAIYPRSFPSIFDDEDNVYNTDPLRGDQRPSAQARKANAEATTRTDTPRRRS